MVLCIPLCCECLTVDGDARPSSDLPEPPKNIICPRCNQITDASYKKDSKKCRICLICYIPCGTSRTYLVCKSCGCNLGSSGCYRCENCHVGTFIRTKYCMNCGVENTRN